MKLQDYLERERERDIEKYLLIALALTILFVK